MDVRCHYYRGIARDSHAASFQRRPKTDARSKLPKTLDHQFSFQRTSSTSQWLARISVLDVLKQVRVTLFLGIIEEDQGCASEEARLV